MLRARARSAWAAQAAGGATGDACRPPLLDAGDAEPLSLWTVRHADALRTRASRLPFEVRRAAVARLGRLRCRSTSCGPLSPSSAPFGLPRSASQPALTIDVGRRLIYARTPRPQRTAPPSRSRSRATPRSRCAGDAAALLAAAARNSRAALHLLRTHLSGDARRALSDRHAPLTGTVTPRVQPSTTPAIQPGASSSSTSPSVHPTISPTERAAAQLARAAGTFSEGATPASEVASSASEVASSASEAAARRRRLRAQ